MSEDPVRETAVFCLGCGYDLRGSGGPLCPECSRRFDPADDRTWTGEPKAWRLRRWRRRILAPAACLVALLVVADVCMHVWLYVGWRAEQPAVAYLKSKGAYIQTLPEGRPVRSNWLEYALLPSLRHFQWRAVTVRLSGRQVGDNDLACLRSLRSLSDLVLAKTNITDAGLQFLRGMGRLNYLDISHTNVTDAGVEHLCATRIDAIRIGGTKITPEGIRRLAACQPSHGVQE